MKAALKAKNVPIFRSACFVCVCVINSVNDFLAKSLIKKKNHIAVICRNMKMMQTVSFAKQC